MAHYDEQPDLDDPDLAPGDDAQRHPLIVGVGAGGSRREALRLLLSRVEQDEHIALVLCIPPLDLVDQPGLFEDISSGSSLKTIFVRHDTRILPGHVYLAPSSAPLTIVDGVLKTDLPPEIGAPHGRIDHLLLSLANDRKERAVAIILAGTGDDGRIGAHAVRREGGLAIAEVAPEESVRCLKLEATHAIAHHVLPADRMAACIMDHARRVLPRYEQGERDDRPTGRARLEATIAELRAQNEALRAAQSQLGARVRELEAATADPGSRIEIDGIGMGGKAEARPRMMARTGPDGLGRISDRFGSACEIHEYRIAGDRQRMLAAELQNRVTNILAEVRSIFSRSIELDGPTETAADHFRGRLDAFARTQNVLARTPDGGIDLEELVHDEMACHGAVSGGQVAIAGPAIRLRRKAAETLGLAIHELAVNAAKYGALALASGRIGVTWRVRDSAAEPRLCWKWAESGVTLIDPAPSRVGFGRDLLEHGLPYQLGANTTLEFASGGMRCTIELPLGERIAVVSGREPGWTTP